MRSGELATVAPERVWQEVARGLAEPRPSRMLAVLDEARALDAVLPEIAQAYPGRRGMRWTALRKALDRAAAQASSLEARYAVLAHDLGPRSDVPAVAARARIRECPQSARRNRHVVPPGLSGRPCARTHAGARLAP